MNPEFPPIPAEPIAEPSKKAIDVRILNQIFWSLIFGNLANIILFMVKTNNIVLQSIIKLLDRGIFPIIGMFIIRGTEGKIKSSWRSKSIAYFIVPIVLIVGISTAGIDITQDAAQNGPSCQPKNMIMKFYESLQLEIFYDVTKDPC